MKSTPEYRYLELLVNISDGSYVGMYGIDNMRQNIHLEILKKHNLEDYYERSKLILSNLDKFIDFKLPLLPTDHLTYYARKLEHWFSCQEGQYFVQGKIYNVNVINGVFES